MQRILALIIASLASMPAPCAAAPHADIALDMAQKSMPELLHVLALPNDAHHREDIELNVQWAEQAFTARGFDVRRLSGEQQALLLAERSQPGAERTLLLYFHMDGQPVDASLWQQADPYAAVLKARDATGQWQPLPTSAHDFNAEDRLFARSAADAKGPVMMFLTALDALKAMHSAPQHNLKVILDFAEEIGSPGLPQAVQQHRAALASDVLVIFDGPRHPSNRPTLTFGARGIVTVSLTVYGPLKPQHSGHYGNFLPNPAQRLAHLLGGMKDDDGRVTVADFYREVRIDDAVRTALADVPDDAPAMLHAAGVKRSEAWVDSYQLALQYPSLNVRGLSAGWVGDAARTIIPDSARAEIDIRLVPETDAGVLLQRLRAHIEAAGYHVVEQAPDAHTRRAHDRLILWQASDAYKAFRTDMDTAAGHWLTRALHNALGQPPVRLRTMGGSIPIAPFVQALNVPAIVVPTVNPDNNQHAANENLRMGNYVEGVQSLIGVMSEPWPADAAGD